MRAQVQGPEVGEAVRAVGEPCGCTYEWGRWRGCPIHPSACEAVVAWDREGRAIACGIPIPAGAARCLEHDPAREAFYRHIARQRGDEYATAYRADDLSKQHRVALGRRAGSGR